MSRRQNDPVPSTSSADPSSLLMSMASGRGGGSGSPRRQAYRAAQERTGLVESVESSTALPQEEIPVLNAEDLLPVEAEYEDDIQRFLHGEITFTELAKRMDAEDQLSIADDLESHDGGDHDIPNISDLRGKGRGRRSKLDEIAEGLLGNAELSFARGSHKDAITMVLEVIREHPMAYEPYQTLGDFYEQLSQDDKALQYYHIAAHLCPSDGENWKIVAEKHVDQGDIKTALKCYDKAIRLIPPGRDNIECRMEKGRILEEEVKDFSKAIETYQVVLDMCEADADGQYAMDLATKIARLHVENKDASAGISVLETAFQKFESHIVSENVNMFLELLIEVKRYPTALMAFRKYCGLQITHQAKGGGRSPRKEVEITTEEILSSAIPDIQVKLSFDMPIDLVSKLIVCLVSIKSLKSVPSLEEQILSETAETTGDLYLDVSDAHMEQGNFDRAVVFLKKLVTTSVYGVHPAVWLRFAKSLKQVGSEEEAIDAFYKVINYEPNHFDARLELAGLLMMKGRIEDAAVVSSQVPGKVVNLDLLLVRTRLLYNQEKWKDFVEVASTFLSSDMLLLTHEKEIDCMIRSSSNRTRLENLRDVHRELKIDPNIYQRHAFVGNDPSPEDYFELYIKLCYVLLYKGSNEKEKQSWRDRLVQLVFSSYTCMSLADRDSSLDFISLMTLFLLQNKEYSYRLFKGVAGRNPSNHQVWNIFCPIVNRFYHDLRHNRFCMRMLKKNPDSLPIAYFNGHNALMSASYKHALGEFYNFFS